MPLKIDDWEEKLLNFQRILGVIEKQEELICFEHFENYDALKVGIMIAEKVKTSERPVAIQIYLDDIFLVFQYTMKGKENWHYGWASRKYEMVKATGHSSMYAMLQNKYCGKWKELETDETKAFACGGFPIKLKNGDMVGVVSISGLVDPKDHEILVSVLSEYIGIKVLIWTDEDLKS